MFKKFVLCVLAMAYCVLVFSDVFAREEDARSQLAIVVKGSLVRAALHDLTSIMMRPNQWRLEELLASKEEPVQEPVLEAPAPLPDIKYADVVMPLSQKYGVDWELIASVMAVESGCNPRAVSEKGAVGLMQVMPRTASLYRIKSVDLMEPKKNIEAGVRHLKMLLERYPGKMDYAVAAYNSGEGAVDRYHGVPPYKPTRNFVRKVMALYQSRKNEQVAATVQLSDKPDKNTLTVGPALAGSY